MALAAYSLTNLTNSVAEVLASTLLSHDYLLYWPTLDALQTPDGVYPQYQANQAAILLSDSAVASRYNDSRGILTIRNDDFSFPQFPTRPTSDGAVLSPEDMPVPSIVLQVQHEGNGGLLGLGSRERERFASLDMYGLARDQGEQLYLVDALRVAFDESQFLTVADHDAGTKASVGLMELQRTSVGTLIYPLGPESRAFEFTLNARLRYEA
jgi:hypothetical protein